MAVSRNVLGMNARNFLYIRKYNSLRSKRIADDKLETKRVLLKNKLPTPKLLSTFENREQIRDYKWNLPADGFVIKPARGYGGQGITALHSWNGNQGKTTKGDTVTIKQLKSHLLDILDGAYSLQYLPDKAFIEERIVLHHFYKKIAPLGIPDIRIIVFNHVPLMAMLRLPTEESDGKANLFLGGLGVGVDIRTGITTYAIQHKNTFISKIPGLALKTRGIKIPDWDNLLLLASKSEAATGLGFAGIDIVVDERYGAMVLEVNARPGLSIQTANLSSLRTRLERVEDMFIATPERAVEVAKSLFAENFSDKVVTTPKILSVIEPITLKGKEREITLKAKLDTGAFRTSIDINLAKQLGIELNKERIFIKSASGQAFRPTVNLTFQLAGRKITTIATAVDRSVLKYPIIIGRRDLKGFLIQPVEEDFVEKSDNIDDIKE